MRVLSIKRIDSKCIEMLKGSEAEKDALRQMREPLLAAFDIWEKAVIRGREADNAVIMAWYRDLLDLKASAFEDVPGAIKKHLGK